MPSYIHHYILSVYRAYIKKAARTTIGPSQTVTRVSKNLTMWNGGTRHLILAYCVLFVCVGARTYCSRENKKRRWIVYWRPRTKPPLDCLLAPLDKTPMHFLQPHEICNVRHKLLSNPRLLWSLYRVEGDDAGPELVAAETIANADGELVRRLNRWLGDLH